MNCFCDNRVIENYKYENSCQCESIKKIKTDIGVCHICVINFNDNFKKFIIDTIDYYTKVSISEPFYYSDPLICIERIVFFS